MEQGRTLDGTKIDIEWKDRTKRIVTAMNYAGGNVIE